MTDYHYEVPESPMEIHYSTTPVIKCNECGERFNYKSWITDKGDSERQEEELDKYTKKVVDKRIKRKLTKTNVVQNDIICYMFGEGTLEFKGWPVWVIDTDKRDVKDRGFVKEVIDRGLVTKQFAFTVKERKELVDELYEKYRGDKDE